MSQATACLGGHALSHIHILFNLVEVQVFVDSRAIFVNDAHGFVILGHCGDVAQLGGDRGQLG